MRSLLASILLSCAACAISACTGTGSGQVTYSGEATASPDLVEISPGVQVIADYDEPVFYSDNYYWREQGGVWYRSHDHQRGWERSEAPERVRTIQRPEAYVHYHASGTARADVRDHRNDGYQQPSYPQNNPRPNPQPEVRDHREGSPGADVRDHRDDRRDDRRDGAGPQPQPQPVQPAPQPQPQTRPPEAMPQRDVRQDDRKDDRKDQREERKDDRREQKDQRKDNREQRKDDKKR